MNAQTVAIERIGRSAGAADVSGLATLLLDAVDSNAGISFLANLTQQEAEDWWRSVLESSSPRAVILVARDTEVIVRHRADAAGVGAEPAPSRGHREAHRPSTRSGSRHCSLMAAIEREGRAAGFTLLVLDTSRGGAAESLYASIGWVRVGEVPGFALNPDGSLCDTVFYYKQLA